MPVQNFIDVGIIVDGRPLQEYLEPEAIDEGSKRVRYVEVKAGQEFAVHVTFKAGFDLRWAEALMSRVKIDDMGFCLGQPLDIDQRYMQHGHGILLHDCFVNMATVTLRNDITGILESCPLTLGVLGISKCGIFTDSSERLTMAQPIKPQ